MFAQILERSLDPSKSAVRGLPDDTMVSFLPMEAVGFGTVFEPSEDRPIGEVRDGYTFMREGDVAFAKISPSFQNGKAGRAGDLTNGIAFATTELTVLRPVDVDARFLQYVLRSDTFLRAGAETLHGVAGQQRVSSQFVQSYPVPLPPLQEQRRIADFLDIETARIDTLLTKNEQAAELVQERFVRLRFDLLSGAHRAESRTLIESPWFESRPSSWQDAKLGAVIRLQRGYDLPADDRLDGDVPVVSSGGVIDTHSVAMEEPPGIVTGRYGTIGELYYIEEPYWPLNTALFVKHLWEVEPRFAYWLLQTVPLAFDSDKSAVTGINRNVIHDVRVPLPPRSEQSGIAERLDEALERRDDLLESLRHQRVLLNERRQALITAVVTGEIEV